MTRWSSQAPRKISRRSQWTSERSEGPTSSGQHSLTCSPSAEAGSVTSPLTTRLIRSSASSSSTASAQEAELPGRLLAALAEVALVEREAQLSVLEDEVVARAVVPASVHGRRDHMWESFPAEGLKAMLQGARLRRGRRGLCSDMESNQPTVLIVEDHAPTRTFLADNLAADGYEPLEAETAADGLRLMATKFPDLAIIDLGLPDRDGLELLREVRAADELPAGSIPTCR